MHSFDLLKKLLFFLLVLVATTAVGSVKSAGFYEQFTYEWTDWQGVTHTSKITEKATSPEQIMALIAKIYGDPNIPGTLKSNTDATPSPSADEMYTNQEKVGFDFGGDVTTPYEEGLTMFLVKVNDLWSITNILVDEGDGDKYIPKNVYYYERNHCDAYYTGKSELYMFISEAIESIQLVTSTVRIEESDPSKCGYMVNIRESLNKFFFMAKGKQRQLGADTQLSYPFGWMFEEFSPTLSSGQEVQTNNVFNYISNGESYSITHICGSVLWQDHQFVLDNENNTSHEVNMSFFIPDYRLKYWTADDVAAEKNIAAAPGRWWASGDGSIYTDNTYYHPDYFPKVFVYSVKVDDAVVKNHVNTDDETGSYSDVTLGWNVNLDDVVGGATVDQIFYIYKVVDGVIQPEPVATITGDQRQCTLVEERGEESREVTYIMSAQPEGSSEFAPVWSNELTVTIPGTLNDYHLNLSVDGNGTCIFDEKTQTNYYANPIILRNGIAENQITWNDVNDEFTTSEKSYYYASRICFYRINKATGEKTRFATMNLRRLSPTNPNYLDFNKDYIMYGEPHYENQVVADVDGVEGADVIYPDVRNITGMGGVNNIPANVLPIVNGVVDFSNLPLLDCFAVSVADNTYPSDYQYQAVFVHDPTTENPQGTADDDVDAANSSIKSNIVTIGVPKTVSQSDYNIHDEEIIAADGEVSDMTQLEALKGGVEVKFNVLNNSRIARYVVTRANDGVRVIVAQRVGDGTYTVYQRGSEGYFNVSTGNYAFPTGTNTMTIVGFDDLRDTDEELENITYRVTVECKNVTTIYGSELTACYGSPVVETSYVTFEMLASERKIIELTKTYALYNQEKYGLTNTNFDNFTIYHYNIWRTLPDGTAELIQTANNVPTEEHWLFEKSDAFEADDCFVHAEPLLVNRNETQYNVTYKTRVYLRPALARVSSAQCYVAEAEIEVPLYYLPTGVDDCIAEDSFNIYPSVVTTSAQVVGEGNIYIYNISGTLVRSINDGLMSRSVDLSTLPAGYYIVVCGSQVREIVKK